MKLSVLTTLPKTSVFALFNPKKNKVHLMYAKNTMVKLVKFLDELKYNKHRNKELCEDVDDLELIILETYSDDSICRMHMNYWYDYILNEEGLELYGNRRNYLQYKLRTSVSAFEYDYLNKSNVDRVYVEFINSRNEGFVVGVFDNVPEATQFSEFVSNNQEYLFTVYASNRLTREFLSKERSREKKLR